MFSSTYHDSNPLPNFPSSSSSSYPTLSFLIDPQNDFPNNTLLDDPLSLPFLPSTTTTHDVLPIFPNETTINANNLATSLFEQDISTSTNVNNCNSNYGVSVVPNFVTQKLPSSTIGKKDRHSKIHTSQGLRDRRVRLSSEIARKFFDLQDMLEFDKPSNTLEWLFTKSESAIKELARTKNIGCCNNNNPFEYDTNNNNNHKNSSFSGVGDNKQGRNKLKWTQQKEEAFVVQTKKESRERARARARERTCYKMCSTSTNGSSTNHHHHNHNQMLQQLMMSSSSPIDHQSSTENDEAYARWRQHLVQLQTYHPSTYSHHNLLDESEIPRDHYGFNVIEESIMIKRNMMSSTSSHHHHQQNLATIPKEPTFNNNNIIDYPNLFPYSTTNWETNGGCSNFYGIATMNLSTCFMNQ
ncbi:uncharacterized protein [Cicer arietinum]|uniref:Transcription factor CYCLOIDEA-like n=1 Tax=Cicer arietinum TaxID=3827 RepID=A0A1S2Y0U0_CICAR|nr:transcription factor CYCLOIDEA-like [Cicer arietinum]